jgi:hypothetical protein
MPGWGWIIAIALAVSACSSYLMIKRSAIASPTIESTLSAAFSEYRHARALHVEDIRFHQSIIDRIVNTGDMPFFPTMTPPRLELYGVPPRPLLKASSSGSSVKRQRGSGDGYGAVDRR